MFLILFFLLLGITALLCLFSNIWKTTSYNLSCFIFKMRGWIHSLLYCDGHMRTSLTFHLLMKLSLLHYFLFFWFGSINLWIYPAELNYLALLWCMVCVKLVKLVPTSLGKKIASFWINDQISYNEIKIFYWNFRRFKNHLIWSLLFKTLLFLKIIISKLLSYFSLGYKLLSMREC